MKNHYSNENLLNLLNSSKAEQDVAIAWIYSNSGWTKIVRKVVRDLNGSKQDQEDIVGEGIAELIVLAQRKKLKAVKNLRAFFVQICKNNWLNKFNRQVKGKDIVNKLKEKTEPITNEEQAFLIGELSVLLDTLLKGLGRKCRDVLKFWSQGFTHEEIAKKVSYENANVSKKSKSTCIDDLKKMNLNPDDWFKYFN